jgi:hypothetical protein
MVKAQSHWLSGKCTRHINIQYFFITDWVIMKDFSIDWCPAKEMVADFMTTPLQGSKFRDLNDYIMGRVRCIKPKADVISLGHRSSARSSLRRAMQMASTILQ